MPTAFATAYITDLVLYDSVLFDIGHHVPRWAASVSRNFEANAKVAAPVNKRMNKSHRAGPFPPGSLQRSISVGWEKIGPKHIQIVCDIGVPYAEHVLYGTGEIFPVFSDKLRLPWNPGFSPPSRRGRESRYESVNGQDPNNFLARAAIPTAVQHSSLRGLSQYLFEQY